MTLEQTLLAVQAALTAGDAVLAAAKLEDVGSLLKGSLADDERQRITVIYQSCVMLLQSTMAQWQRRAHSSSQGRAAAMAYAATETNGEL